MKNRVIQSVLAMFILLLFTTPAYSQWYGQCPPALSGCAPVTTRTISVNVGTLAAPCLTNITFCIACCNGIGHIYFKEASWNPGPNCPSQWPIFQFLQRADDPTKQKILAAMITDASSAFTQQGLGGCGVSLTLIPPCPEESNQKWTFYKAACAHTILRSDPVTNNTTEVYEGCGSYDYCNSLLTTCWDYTVDPAVLKITSVSLQTSPGAGIPVCNYTVPEGVTEVNTCQIVCP